MTEKELKALLADMTLEEKVDQMNQVAAGMFSGDITAMGPMAAKLYPPEVLDRTGSVLGRHGSGSAEKASERADRKAAPQNPNAFHAGRDQRLQNRLSDSTGTGRKL